MFAVQKSADNRGERSIRVVRACGYPVAERQGYSYGICKRAVWSLEGHALETNRVEQNKWDAGTAAGKFFSLTFQCSDFTLSARYTAVKQIHRSATVRDRLTPRS